MADTFQSIVNPLTPLAYLKPAAAAQYRVAAYVILGSAGAFFLDVVSNIHHDYRLLFHHQIGFPTLVYFFSRLAVFASLTVNCIFRTAPLGLETCKGFQVAACVTYHLAFSSTTLLFYLRLRAVFNRNKYVVAFFLFLWVAVMAATLTVAFAGGSNTMGPTNYCIGVPIQPYVAASPITIAVNDTCVFLAISWRLMQSSYRPSKDESTTSKIKHMFSGRHLPVVSRAIFKDGQAYYLFSVVSNILAVYTVTSPSVPSNYRFMYAFNCVVANMMAGRVFRHTKFGHFRERAISTTVLNMQEKAWHHGLPDSVPSTKTNTDSSRTTVKVQEKDLLQRLSPGIMIGSIILIMILIPIVCVYICIHKRHKAMK